MRRRIGIIGCGAWGRALAHVAQSAGNQVRTWSRSAPVELGWGELHAIIVALPAQVVRHVMARLPVPPGMPIIISAKGIERDTGLFMHEVMGELWPGRPALVLSGPSFAEDVMQGLPTAVTLAAPSLAEAGEWAERLSLPQFRIYASDDVRGVEIGGSLKNVLAIACGISDGRGLGASARAALTTRGFAELQRLGRKLGARPETLMGLSGLGDLLLTCSSPQSRNFAFGLAIGRGASVEQAVLQSHGVVEGAATARIACEIAEKAGVEMPIVSAVTAIIDEGASPDQQIARLLARPAGKEM
jgi:glycerol-3-phosphate dehydrogenase (NAD(P)+)